MLGTMTIVWAWAEITLSMTVGIIIEKNGMIPGYVEAPISLKRRVECLKVALRDIPVLKGLQNEGGALAICFKELGGRRNNLVHGAAWEVKEGGFQAIGLAVKGGNYLPQDHRFDIADAVILNTEITKLQDDAMLFMIRVAAAMAA
jgi:hypothetical protein